MKSCFRDKLHFKKVSLYKNGSILLMMLASMLIGAVVIYNGLKNDITFLLIFGGIIVVVPLFVLITTMPFSFLHYYEQAQAKKYGAYTTAQIIENEEKDVSYFNNVDNREIRIGEFQYFLTYAFDYNDKTYQNTFLVASKNCFEALPVGTVIPIKFLKTNPNTSSVRNRKMANELGLTIKEC